MLVGSATVVFGSGSAATSLAGSGVDVLAGSATVVLGSGSADTSLVGSGLLISAVGLGSATVGSGSATVGSGSATVGSGSLVVDGSAVGSAVVVDSSTRLLFLLPIYVHGWEFR